MASVKARNDDDSDGEDEGDFVYTNTFRISKSTDVQLLLAVACKFWGIAAEAYECFWEGDEELKKYDLKRNEKPEENQTKEDKMN